MNELQQATTKELLAELQARYPHLLFAGLQEAPGEPDADDTFISYRGGLTAAIGLGQRAMDLLLAESRKDAGDMIAEDDDDAEA